MLNSHIYNGEWFTWFDIKGKQAIHKTTKTSFYFKRIYNCISNYEQFYQFHSGSRVQAFRV